MGYPNFSIAPSTIISLAICLASSLSLRALKSFIASKIMGFQSNFQADMSRYKEYFRSEMWTDADGLHDAGILTLARGFFPAKARAIEGNCLALTLLNSHFDGAFGPSSLDQDRPFCPIPKSSQAKPEKDLRYFKKMYDSSADLKRLAESPVFATEDKAAALTAVAKKAKLSALTQQFIGTVAGNRRAADRNGCAPPRKPNR